MNTQHKILTRNKHFRLAAVCALLSLAAIVLVSCQAPQATFGSLVGSTVQTREVDDREMGVLPTHATVFDESLPGISGLSPDLRNALEQATRAAREEGVEIFINSGWRAPALQEQLLTEAVSDYGSLEEAARWVATPETSAHVSGDAVDIGDLDAYLWFQERSSGFGLCQIYANEPWHYEYRPDALSEGCPQPYLDPTHDPNLQN